MRKLLLPIVICAAACTFAPRIAAAIGDAPSYGSPAMSNMGQQWGFGTPEEDGRPGEYYFIKAVEAVRHKQYRFAIDMYETSASWAYKPAEYNLAVIYMNGEGVPVDKPRAMAWAALAAERDDADYVQARETIYAALSTDEFAQANAIWRDLKKTYGDDVALARAKMRWAQVKAGITGSRVGGVGNLKVGSGGKNFKPINVDTTGRATLDANTFSAFGVLGASAIDGTVAYKQLRESANPYDPKFEQQPLGTATVEPIVPLPADAKPADDPQPRNL